MHSIKIILVLLLVWCSCSVAMVINVPPNESLLSPIITGENKNIHTTSIKSDVDCSQFGSDFDVLDQFPFHVVINPTVNKWNTSHAFINDEGTHITSLDIHSEIAVPLSTFCLTNLTRLGIWSTPFHNGIVPDTLANLKQLRKLMVYNSSIVSFTEQLETLSGLDMLFLVDCSLTHVPNLSALHDLQKLDLAGNMLSQVDGITDLKYLWLGENNFTQMPKMKTTENLKLLSMDNNPLQNIQEITSYTSLQDLYLRNISLSSVPSTIDRLEKVTTLDLSSNKLFYLPNNIFNMANLNCLIIHDNLFSSFDIQALQMKFSKTHPNMTMYAYIGDNEIIDE